MKKTLIFLLTLVLVILPFNISAAEKKYNTLNLDQALTAEEIEHDFSNYKENDNQAIIYLFRGQGCGFCKRFLTFLNSIIDEYGKYFKVVSYEVWKDSDNNDLMNEVAQFLGTTAGGVPFIVIGDQVFPGYASDYDDAIKQAIKEQYDSKNSYDVMKEMEKAKKQAEKEANAGSISSTTIIIYNFIFIAVATVVILVFSNSNKNQTLEKIDDLKTELTKEMSKVENDVSNTNKTNKSKKSTTKVDK